MDFRNFTTEDLMKLNNIHKKRKSLLLDIKDLEDEYRNITSKMKSMGCIIDGRIEEPKTRHMRIGKKKFNINPEEGLKYLISEKIVTETPMSVANFLSDYTLNKKCVGDYLGNVSNPFNSEVLIEFVKLYDFTGFEFVDALRLFLTGFQLPGESQKIDKIMSLWSKWYHTQNPEYFNNETEAYIMTYAVILLNTSLYNPTAKKCNGGFGKEEDFLKIMKGCNSDTNYDLKFVKDVFKNIKSQPLLCTPTINNKKKMFGNSLVPIEKSGWLWKLGGRIKNWKKRWFVLCESQLFYLMFPDSQSYKGVIQLDNLMIHQIEEKAGKFCFEIFSNSTETIKASKTDKDNRCELGHHNNYKMYCNSKMELEQWVESIQRRINTTWQLKLLSNIE